MKEQNHFFVEETLLGGAALTVSDLVSIQAQEIKWYFLSTNEEDLDIGSKPMAA